MADMLWSRRFESGVIGTAVSIGRGGIAKIPGVFGHAPGNR